MSLSCECCALSGKGHCVGPITRPEESYRVWCVCDREASKMMRPWPSRGCCAVRENYGINNLSNRNFYRKSKLTTVTWSVRNSETTCNLKSRVLVRVRSLLLKMEALRFSETWGGYQSPRRHVRLARNVQQRSCRHLKSRRPYSFCWLILAAVLQLSMIGIAHIHTMWMPAHVGFFLCVCKLLVKIAISPA
jgi:hypothetical protein